MSMVNLDNECVKYPLLISMFLTSTALADTWTVDDDGKADFDNIQDAVNAASDGDEIIVAPGTYTSKNDVVVNIDNKEIWLHGIDPDYTFVDGESVRKGFLCTGEKTGKTVIENLTITNCYTSQWGAGMRNFSDLTLANCIFSNNSCEGSSNWGGGGMYSQGSPTLSNCTFINNMSGRLGGGMHHYANSAGYGASITNCLFLNNTSISSGGGMYLSGQNVTALSNCTFEGNEGISCGGFWCDENTSVTLTNCTVANNIANEYSGGGFCSSGDVTLIDTIVCENVPNQIWGHWHDGGGACVASSCQDQDGDGLPDKCGGVGDGVHHVPSEYPTIQDAIDIAGTGDEIIIAPGTYTGDGDAVFNTRGKQVWIHSSGGPDVTIIDGEETRVGILCITGESNTTIIEGLTITKTQQSGAIVCYYTSPIIRNCVIRESFGWFGFYCDQSNPVLDGCIFSNNGCYYGALYSRDSDIKLTNCTFENNNKGAMYCLGGNPTVTSCTFTNNSGHLTTPVSGGAIYFVSDMSYPDNSFEYITITGSTFTNNESTTGGAIYVKDAIPLIDDCLIADNTASSSSSGNGGGIYLEINLLAYDGIGFTPKISNCTFNGNQMKYPYPESNGGGIFIDVFLYLGEPLSFPIAIENCSFANNSLESPYGSAIGSVGNGAISILDCVFENNTNLYDWGSPLYCNEFTTVTDTLLCGNTPNEIVGNYIDGGGNCISSSCEDADGDGWPDFCTSVGDEVLEVPQEYSTIRDAINAADDGDEIVIAPGTYTDTGQSVIKTHGKQIWIHSSDGPEVTIIDGEDIRQVIRCTSGETSKTIIEGLTITRGLGAYFGEDPDYILAGGGGAFCDNGSPIFKGCVFSNNNASDYGGALFNRGENTVLENCIFVDNQALSGGAVNCWRATIFLNCVIKNNTAAYYDGGIVSNSYASLTNTTVCGNTPNQIGGEWTDNGGNTIADECPLDCPDINGDGYVNVTDLLVVIDQWGLTDSPADLNQDGIVDVTDLLIVVGNWGPCE